MIVLFLFLVSLFAVKALFHPGFYTSHDGEHQMIRLNHFLVGLKDGQWPVRWAGPPAFRGFGYPLFVFTYRFPFYLGAFFSFLGLSLSDSIKAVFILAYLFSGIVMYWAQKKIWGNRLAALIGALFYLWAPWRFSTIFVRASLGEAVCFFFFPLAIWALVSLREKENQKAIFIGAFSLAGLLLSHAMLTFLFLPFFVFLAGFCLWQTGKKKEVGYRYLKLFILAAGISAYYWLPILIERRWAMFSRLLTNFYTQHFPNFKQLLYSPWGYGFSHPGVERDAMSFQVGIAQWLVVILMFFLLVWRRIRKEKFEFFHKLAGLLVFFFATSIFLMLSLSKPCWQMMSLFFKIDFPFRYLALTTLFSSLIAGGLVTLLRKERLLKSFLYPVVLGLLFLTFYGNRNHLRVNQYLDLPDSFYQEHYSSSSSFDEYRPLWVNPKYLPRRETPVTGSGGQAETEVVEMRSNLQAYRIGVKEASSLILNTIYYPGWELFIDGQKEKMEITTVTGLMRIPVVAGKHEVLFKFGKTWDRIIGEALTLVTLIFIGYQLRNLWKK